VLNDGVLDLREDTTIKEVFDALMMARQGNEQLCLGADCIYLPQGFR
jgi:hypothetical protein